MAASPGAEAPTETSGVGTTPAAEDKASPSPSENGRKSKGVCGKASDKDKAGSGSGKDKKGKGGEKDKGSRGKGGGGAAAVTGGGAGGNNQIRKKAPVFLFFTVHQTGQFCGVAQMLGPLDHGGQKVCAMVFSLMSYLCCCCCCCFKAFVVKVVNVHLSIRNLTTF